MTYLTLTDADLLPPLQSGFRPGHSTESAVLCVLPDILLLPSTVATLPFWSDHLDLSAAFDTVDHDISFTASGIELWDRRRRKGLVPVL